VVIAKSTTLSPLIPLSEEIKKRCMSCRRCCILSEIRLIPEDIVRWKKEERLDILLSINSLLGESRQLIKKKNSDECIFLTEEGCKIHDTKPYICRKFPTSGKHAEAFDCKLIGLLDLKN
jgi:Fe-S-cluster containining protein